jgi:hypothetical protein
MTRPARDPALLREALLLTLRDIESILERVGEEHWRRWIAARKNDINAWYEDGVSDLLSGYGGMGSFNDLVLHPMNGHRLSDSETASINEGLSTLRSTAYRQAMELRRCFG